MMQTSEKKEDWNTNLDVVQVFQLAFCNKRSIWNTGSKEPTAWELEPNAVAWECSITFQTVRLAG